MGIQVNPAETLLDGRILHNHCPYSISDSRKLLDLISASQRYKVLLYRMRTEEVAVHSGVSTVAEFYSIADSSTTTRRIPILFPGG